MADITNPTSNTSIYDESGNLVEVRTAGNNKELHVHDAEANDWLEEIAEGTTVVSTATTTSWEYFAKIDKAFATTYSATLSGGSGEKDYILLENPAASGYYCRIKRIIFGVGTPSTAATFRIYKVPTITANGTALNIGNFRDNTATGVVNAYHTPTISARGNVFETFELNSSGVGALSIHKELALFILESDFILLTIQQYANNKDFSVNVEWAEEEIPTP